MAFKLDNALLEELGLAALPPQDKEAMLQQILETLEMRVGTTLASRMSDQQLDEFERLMPAAGDQPQTVQQKEQQALQWLESNFPDYKQVVNDELNKRKAEIKQSASQIMAASQQQGLAGPEVEAQPAVDAAGPTSSSFSPPPASQPAAYNPAPPNYAQSPTDYNPQQADAFSQPASSAFSNQPVQSAYPPQMPPVYPPTLPTEPPIPYNPPSTPPSGDQPPLPPLPPQPPA